MWNTLKRSLARAAAGRRQLGTTTGPAGLDPIQEALLDEQCILVDEQDRPLGQASKRHCHLVQPDGTSPLHRAFSLFIFNERDELLMQQRSLAKITFPGLWTNTCCSHPLAVAGEREGEKVAGDKVAATAAAGVRNAARRRVKAELDIDLDQQAMDDMTYVTRILYAAPSGTGGTDADGRKWAEHELDYILLLRSREPIRFKPDPNEIKAVEFVARHELGEFIETAKGEEGSGVTPWFDLIAKSMLPVWWRDLDRISEHCDHKNIRKF